MTEYAPLTDKELGWIESWNNYPIEFFDPKDLMACLQQAAAHIRKLHEERND